eukprot:gnl/MRDRNA2_/MRDRNA2_103072_c0_seq1.p1 gnl/MRDRNA2_/MRDRNA2_103072_c0~~gnl/MRDRNA2_/MRDRNA2_103072_c0_seq1.p1  ORF type:complete len:684 (+),score=108.95 gnl/MRDRNA2_/MRDRNA2_103072_c0_seq1:153-2054(+)
MYGEAAQPPAQSLTPSKRGCNNYHDDLIGDRSVRPKVDEHFTKARRQIQSSPLCLHDHLPETQCSSDAALNCWIRVTGHPREYFAQLDAFARNTEHTVTGRGQIDTGYGQTPALQRAPMPTGTRMHRSVPATTIPDMKSPAPTRMGRMQERADFASLGTDGLADRGSRRVDGPYENSYRRVDPGKAVVPLEARHPYMQPQSNQPPYQWPPASVGGAKAYVHGGRELWTEYPPTDDSNLNDSHSSSFSLKDLPAQKTDSRQSLEHRPPSIGRTVYVSGAAPVAGTAHDSSPSRTEDSSSASGRDSRNASRLSEQSSIPAESSATDQDSVLGETSMFTDDGLPVEPLRDQKRPGRQPVITHGYAEVHTEVQAEAGHVVADPGDAAAGGGCDLSHVKYPKKNPRINHLPKTLLPDYTPGPKDQTEEETEFVMRQLSVRAQAELALLKSVWGENTRQQENGNYKAEGLILGALQQITRASLKTGFKTIFSGTETSSNVKVSHTGKRSDEELELEREIAELEAQKSAISADITQLLKFESVGLQQLNKAGTDLDEARNGATGPLPPENRHFEQEAMEVDRSITTFEQQLGHIEMLVDRLGLQYDNILKESHDAAAATIFSGRKYPKRDGINALVKLVI